MSEDPKLRSEWTEVMTDSDQVALEQPRSSELDPHMADAPLRPQLVEPLARDGAPLPSEIDNAQIIPRRQRGLGLPSVALPRLKISPLLASFVGCVLAPAFAATVYFAFIASDQYTAEARFAVRQFQSTSSSKDSGADGNTLGSPNVDFSFTASGQDAYVVTSYIQSRAIVDDLDKKLALRDMFRRPEADFWARLKRNASSEELTNFWKSMAYTYIDAPSGIVTVRVRAFRPDDAVAIANAVLQLSETLVNRISDRARHDAMAMSEEEVRRSYEKMQSALGDLNSFRDSAGIIDPTQAGTEIGKLLLPLLTEKIRLESDLFVASRNLNDSAPTVKALNVRLQTVEQQIAALRAKLTNPDGDNKTLAASLAKFEALDLNRQFAEKLYSLARIDLDRARQRAYRASIYLTVFVPPSQPEEARYPRRVAFPALIFLGLTIIWAIAAMTIASVQDHRL
jgi:capsular polysaccharide transport system permease protein